MKNALPYVHGVFLLAVWLFSRSDAILAIFFIPDLPLLKPFCCTHICFEIVARPKKRNKKQIAAVFFMGLL